MRDRRHAAGCAHQRDSLFDGEAVFLDVAGLVRTEQKIEGVRNGRDVTPFDQRARHVRTAYRATGSELLDALRADVVAEGAQLLDDAAAARLPRLAEMLQSRRDPFIVR